MLNNERPGAKEGAEPFGLIIDLTLHILKIPSQKTKRCNTAT
jgi:hypothetical protein